MTGRVLVTGAPGFAGRAVVREFAERGYSVIGASREPEPGPEASPFLDDYLCVDLTATFPDVAVDAVVHLAGIAAIGASFDDPQTCLDVNGAMMTRLGEQLLAAGSSARVVVVSTGAVYDHTGDGRPSDESTPIAESSPYVVSKLLVEHQVAYYRRRGLDALVVRPFNHVGPWQGPGFIVPDLLAKLRALTPGATLEAGNLDSARDYLDVRDVAAAYADLAALAAPAHGVYNVASGESRTGHEVLAALSAALGIGVPEVATHADRALDPSIVVGDASRLRAETGWAPKHSLTEAIAAAVAV